jgi:integrase
MNEWIDLYIESKKNSWAPSSMHTERSRLQGLTVDLLLDPAALYKYLVDQGLKPYAVKTKFIRAGDFLEWAMLTGRVPQGRNAIKDFMKSHANLFKNAYTKKPTKVDFAEARRRINKITDPECKRKALELLKTGMRYSESNTLTEDNMIVGKGGAGREVPTAAGMKKVKFQKSYSALHYHLKKVGLTAHMLRKAHANELVRVGAKLPDLMALMGWKSIQTPASYLEAHSKNTLVDAFNQANKLPTTGDDDGEQA